MSTDDTKATADGTESMVDWDFAVNTARRLTRPGPQISREEAVQAVSDLREFAALSEGHVREYTGLHTSGGRAPVLVVDRIGWVQANADGFREVLAPLAAKVREKRGDQGESGSGSNPLGSFGARVTGFEAGALLAFLSGKVLGQFDPFWNGGPPSNNGHGTPVGRLLLVAPNVVHVERELGVVPRDFRLWVCLHEETHRVQFTANPWLRDYLKGQIGEFLQQTDLDPSAMLSQLRQGLEQVGKAVRGEGGEEVSFIDLVQTPAQRAILDRVTAVMSLLEGHADVVMDGVGPGVIPTVEQIRDKFQQRRGGGTWLDQMLKRLLGLDAKMKQYRDGAIFVRGAVDRVGMEGFNRVWTSAETLPTKAEITDPDAWVRRVHGDAAVA